MPLCLLGSQTTRGSWDQIWFAKLGTFAHLAILPTYKLYFNKYSNGVFVKHCIVQIEQILTLVDFIHSCTLYILKRKVLFSAFERRSPS